MVIADGVGYRDGFSPRDNTASGRVIRKMRGKMDHKIDHRTLQLIDLAELKSAKIKLAEATMRSVLSTTRSTVVGALNGSSVVYMNKAQFKAESNGRNALIFGGFSDDNKIVMKNIDATTDLSTDQGRDSFAKDEDFSIINGRSEFKINGGVIERNRVIDPSEFN